MLLKGYPKHVESEVLVFRPLLLEDASIWQAFLEAPETTEYFPEFMKANDRLRGLHWVEKQIMRYRDQQGGLMAVLDKKTGAFMGQSGCLVQHIDGKTELEVGYHFFPKFWGNGFATEAGKFFKELAFSISNVQSIVSYIEKNNIASQKVAERNGMHISAETRWKELDIFIYRVNRQQSSLRP